MRKAELLSTILVTSQERDEYSGDATWVWEYV